MAVKQKTPRGLSLRKNISWAFMGNLVYAICQWGTITILTKLSTPDVVGRFSLGLAVATPILALTNLQLRGIQATDAREEYSFADYMGVRSITTLLAMIVIFGIAVVNGFKYAPETFFVIALVGLSKCFEAISDMIFGLLQHRERMDLVGQSMIMKGLLSLFVMGATLYFTHSIIWASLALALVMLWRMAGFDAGSAANVLSRDVKRPTLSDTWQAIRPRFQPGTMKSLALLAMPLGAGMFLLALLPNAPRYIIQAQLGESALGIYAAIAYLQYAGTIVVSAMGQSATPRLARYYADNNRKAFVSLLGKLTVICIVLGLGMIALASFAGKPILTLLYKPEYAEQTDVFVILMLSAGIIFIASIFGYGMTAARHLKIQVPLTGLSVIVVVLMSYLLIPQYGLIGAAWAQVGASFVQLLGTFGVNLWAIGRMSTVKVVPET